MLKSLVIPVIFLVATFVTITEAQVANDRVVVDKWWAGQNLQQIREESTFMDFNLRLKNQSGKTIDAIKWDIAIIDEHALSDKDRVFKWLTYRDGYLRFKTGEKKTLTRAEDLPEVVGGKKGQYTYVIEGFLVVYEDGTEEYIICSPKYVLLRLKKQRED